MSKQRLHPAGIIIFLAQNTYKFIQALLPLLVIVMSNRQLIHWLYIIAPACLIGYIFWAVAYWWRYVFYIEGYELRLEYGVLNRKKMFIPLNRIQAVHLSAGILQRLLGLFSLEVETAGGGTEAEVSLPALSREIAENLRQALQVKDAAAGNSPAEAGADFALSPRDLLIAGSTSNGIGLVLAFLLTLGTQLDEIFPEIYKEAGKLAGGILESGINAIILSVLLLLLCAWLISVVNVVLKFGNFQLQREGNDIKISRGLLESHQFTVPVKRIQAIKIVEGVLRGPLGLVSVEIVNAAYAGKRGEANILFPLIRKRELISTLSLVVPEFATGLEVETLPRRARSRYLLVNMVPALIFAVILSIYVPWGYLSWALLPLTFLLGQVQYRDAGLKVMGDKIVMRTRWLGMKTMIIPRRRVQSLVISTSFLQKRKELQTAAISIASGIGGERVAVAGVDKSKGSQLQDWLDRSQK